jgi:hypothetical protein
MDISKDNKKKPVDTSVCYGVAYPQLSSCMDTAYIGSCASFGSGQHNVGIGVSGMHTCNDQFIETHNE